MTKIVIVMMTNLFEVTAIDKAYMQGCGVGRERVITTRPRTPVGIFSAYLHILHLDCSHWYQSHQHLPQITTTNEVITLTSLHITETKSRILDSALLYLHRYLITILLIIINMVVWSSMICAQMGVVAKQVTWEFFKVIATNNRNRLYW